jgi:hypothetical protein
MTKPEFQPKLNDSGTWFVARATGTGPESHIGDFLTEARLVELGQKVKRKQ